MNVRTLGLITMLCAPALLIDALRHGMRRTLNGENDLTGNLLTMAFAVGWWCAMLGLKRLHATGRGRLGRTIVTLPLVTIAFAVLQEGLDILHVDMQHPLYIASDLAWPLSDMRFADGFECVYTLGILLLDLHDLAEASFSDDLEQIELIDGERLVATGLEDDLEVEGT